MRCSPLPSPPPHFKFTKLNYYWLGFRDIRQEAREECDTWYYE
jgi:hypothetical protein